MTTKSSYSVPEIEAMLAKITPAPWEHFYPAARDFAHYGVIRPSRFCIEQNGVTVDTAPASGIRYQVEGLGTVNGADRHAIAYTSEPKNRSSFSVDPQERAFKLAHEQTRTDGEFIAASPTIIRFLLDERERAAASTTKLREALENSATHAHLANAYHRKEITFKECNIEPCITSAAVLAESEVK